MRWAVIFLGVVFVAPLIACEGQDQRPSDADAGDAGPEPARETSVAPDGTAPVEASAQCETAANCPLPDSDPAGCVVAECTDRRCTYHTEDADGDGYFAQDRCRVTDGSVELVSGNDCDDEDPRVHPGAWDGPAGLGPNGETEPDACNKKDDNCDGLGDNLQTDGASCTCSDPDYQYCWADTTGAPIPYPANQLDGVGTCHRGIQTCNDGAWSLCYNASGPERERCDGLDNDCDGQVDNDAIDAQPYYCDHDKDDHLAPGTESEVTCPTNLTDCEGGVWRAYESKKNRFDDCDDGNPARWPGNSEVCDGVDNDCDPEQLVDEIREDDGGLIDLKKTYYRDRDGDGFGDDHVRKHVCPRQLDGYVENPGDCDDSDRDVNPTAPELCNGIDDNCDRKTDAEDPKLSGKPTMAGTEFACEEGKWIVKLCPGTALNCDDDVLNGCESDGTALGNCHACGKICAFSCAESGCDEISSISAGGSHTCAVTAGGIAACWGSNEYGQLGDQNVTIVRFSPVHVAGLPSSVKSIQAGMFHTCAIAGTDQALYCWGANESHQVGAVMAFSNTTVPSPEPVDNVIDFEHPEQMTLIGVAAVALGRAHTCAIYHSSHLACWGDNRHSQVLDRTQLGDEQAAATPILRLTASGDGSEIDDAVSVVVGGDHTCILNQAGDVECWGSNANGEAGTDSGGADVPSPTLVAGVSNVSQIAAGRAFTCALASGDVYCWGNNDSQQLGMDGSSSSVPSKVPGLPRSRAIALGAYHACAISDTTDAQLICWGANTAGQLGKPPESLGPARSSGILSDVGLTTAGYAHTCAIDAAHRASCWGGNDSGQLGRGRVGAAPHPDPLAIAPLD